jgi:hypothetical protein
MSLLSSRGVSQQRGSIQMEIVGGLTSEHVALMTPNILNSPRAVAMSVYVIRAFVKMREDVAANAAILRRLAEIDLRPLQALSRGRNQPLARQPGTDRGRSREPVL